MREKVLREDVTSELHRRGKLLLRKLPWVVLFAAIPFWARGIDALMAADNRAIVIQNNLMAAVLLWLLAARIRRAYLARRRARTRASIAAGHLPPVGPRAVWTLPKSPRRRLRSLEKELHTTPSPFTQLALARSAPGTSAETLAEMGPELWESSIAEWARSEPAAPEAWASRAAARAVAGHELGATVTELRIFGNPRAHARMTWNQTGTDEAWGDAVVAAAGLLVQHAADTPIVGARADSRAFFDAINHIEFTQDRPHGYASALTREVLVPAVKAQASAILTQRAEHLHRVRQELLHNGELAGFQLRDTLATGSS